MLFIGNPFMISLSKLFCKKETQLYYLVVRIFISDAEDENRHNISLPLIPKFTLQLVSANFVSLING